MRLSGIALASCLMLLVATGAGQATTIVQTITGLDQTLGDFTPFDINALPFDPATGTLDSVSVELIGTYVPRTANDLGPFPATTTLTTHLFVFAANGGATHTDSLGSQTNVPVAVASQGSAGIATGAATPVDATFDLAELAGFDTGRAGSQILVEYGFGTANTLSRAGGGSDLTSFTGEAILTYAYTIPEPGTAALMLTGLLGLGWSRRRGGLMTRPG